MSLAESKRIYVEAASRLGDYHILSKNELAFGYIAAKVEDDQALKDSYFGAIVERYWHKIYKWKLDSKSLRLEDDDYVSWLHECAWLALEKYTAWCNLDDPLSKDPNGFDKVMNRLCFSIRMREYQIANKAVRKYNTETCSLNKTISDDQKEAPVDYIPKAKGPGVDGAKILVESFLNKDKTIEALIIDGIAYQDSFKDKKVVAYTQDEDGTRHRGYTSTQSSFDMRRLVKHLTTLDDEFMQGYFCDKYNWPKNKGEELLEKMHKTSNVKLYKYIEKTLEEIKQNPELLECLLP